LKQKKINEDNEVQRVETSFGAIEDIASSDGAAGAKLLKSDDGSQGYETMNTEEDVL